MSPKRIRTDADAWRRLLERRSVRNTWHFSPLCCVPSILFRNSLLSIEEANRLGLRVPARESRDYDIEKGVGDVVKLSHTYPYWKMLSKIMRRGTPEVIFELANDPILWAGTYFGNSNVWEFVWQTGSSLDFASQKVFVSRSKWDGNSPPEIYVPKQVPLDGILIRIHTVLDEERGELEGCLRRLNLLRGIALFSSGFSPPFPGSCRDEYLKNQPEHFQGIRRYFGRVSEESLRRGVELD